jgi:hypothetical protein
MNLFWVKTIVQGCKFIRGIDEAMRVRSFTGQRGDDELDGAHLSEACDTKMLRLYRPNPSDPLSWRTPAVVRRHVWFVLRLLGQVNRQTSVSIGDDEMFDLIHHDARQGGEICVFNRWLPKQIATRGVPKLRERHDPKVVNALKRRRENLSKATDKAINEGGQQRN